MGGKSEASQAEIRKLKIDGNRTVERVTEFEKSTDDANEKLWSAVQSNYSHHEKERANLREHFVKLSELQAKLEHDLYGDGGTIQQLREKDLDLESFVGPF